MKNIAICNDCKERKVICAVHLCRECYNKRYHKKRVKDNKNFNIEKYQNRKSNQNYKEKHRKAVDNWSKRNPEKKKAQLIAQETIKIKEGTICSKCNVNLATQRHHPDYSRPKYVKLVCNKCHKSLHNNSKDTQIQDEINKDYEEQ